MRKENDDRACFRRAFRAHILTFTAIGILISREINIDSQKKFDEFISSFLHSWDSKNAEPGTAGPTLGDCSAEPSINDMTRKFITQLDKLKNRGPTAQLRIQYFELVVIALQFVEAERIGNWNLHLRSMQNITYLPCNRSLQLCKKRPVVSPRYGES